MQTSILWEGSLPSKEEMEQMKREGYQFRMIDGGWKICLKLHFTPTGRYFANGFSKAFSKEVELHQYLEQVEKRADWFEVPSKDLRVYEIGPVLDNPKSEAECTCMEVLTDTKKHSPAFAENGPGRSISVRKFCDCYIRKQGKDQRCRHCPM